LYSVYWIQCRLVDYSIKNWAWEIKIDTGREWQGRYREGRKMDFGFTEEQKLLEETVRRFVEKECPREYLREIDEKGEFPFKIWEKIAQMGWFGIGIPEEYGGSGGDIMDLLIVLKGLTKPSMALGVAYTLGVLWGGETFLAWGTEEQKRFYLPEISRGKLRFDMALTEPSGGTDLLMLRAEARLKDGHYIINGQKTFITGASVADYIITLVRTDKSVDKKSKGLTLFIVDAKSPGLEIRRLKKLGVKAVSFDEIFYSDVKVSKENILGRLNDGFYDLLEILNTERVLCAGTAIATAEGAFEEVLEYAKQREAFGKPLGQIQVIQHHLANMAIDITTANLLLYKAAWLRQMNRPNIIEGNMANLVATEVAEKVTSIGMNIMGGYSYSMEFDIQRHWRDAKHLIFAPISNDMIRNFIGERLLGLPRSY
jgi:butyryl-CoA dehydrogenase